MVCNTFRVCKCFASCPVNWIGLVRRRGGFISYAKFRPKLLTKGAFVYNHPDIRFYQNFVLLVICFPLSFFTFIRSSRLSYGGYFISHQGQGRSKYGPELPQIYNFITQSDFRGGLKQPPEIWFVHKACIPSFLDALASLDSKLSVS